MPSGRPNKRVFVAMSGGVDSSVAAALLKDAGYDVSGVTMTFKTGRELSGSSCSREEGVEAARTAAGILGIPHSVMNFADDLETQVIQDFISEYVNGRTPNPCVRCNHRVKFGSLLEKVMALGADYLATGHYVQNVFVKETGRHILKKARDLEKDQSYFLYGLRESVLQSVVFPLGGLMKSEVRALARTHHLNTAERPESQDICFISSGGYRKFIQERTGLGAFVPGPFKNSDGNVVGQHQGVGCYTIGQRERLGIALGFPVYVYRIDPEENTVYVGPKEYLLSDGLIAKECYFSDLDFSGGGAQVLARIRYNAPEVKASVFPVSGDEIRVEFDTPQYAVTPGQAVVFYNEDRVLGGAVIVSSLGRFRGAV